MNAQTMHHKADGSAARAERGDGMNRRQFLVTAMAAAGGMAIGVGSGADAATMTADPAAKINPPGSELNAWIVIDPAGKVLIRVAQSEMGEGIFTALPMIVAEELGCDWADVRAEYADAGRNRETKVYRSMLTGGSGAVRRSREMLQQAGASARVRLVAAAAKKMMVDPATLVVEKGHVHHRPSKRSLGFGVLAADAAGVAIAQEPAIKTPDQFTLIGQPVARLDTPHKVTGKALYGIDVRLPGMLYAAVAVCPVFGGTVKSFDQSAILSRRGIKAVVKIDNGVAVVADNFWRAKEALAVLPIEWDKGAGAGTDSRGFAEDYRRALDGETVVAKKNGDPAPLLAAAKQPVGALYEVPYLSHAQMEPLNCTAHVTDQKVEVWIGTQNPDSALEQAAKAAGRPIEQVVLHNCFLGGGFGRRAVNDELTQAVTVSMAVGAPVKLIWTREEDMRHGRYRPQAAIRFKAAIDATGVPQALEVCTAVGSLVRSLGFGKAESGFEGAAIEGLANMPYKIPNFETRCVLKNTHVPVMFWRSVGSSQNAFAMESFIDEMAHAAGKDPLTLRRDLLDGHEDYLKVLDLLAQKGDWGKPLPAGRGRGLAIHESFGTIVGEIAEVTVGQGGTVKVDRVVAVVDCGHVVNPRTVEMQMESGIIYGLTAALTGAITIKDGAVVEGNFDTYPVMRLADSPKIETYFSLSKGTRWGGIGEPGTPPIAPALCNAIFAATGKRIRALPLLRDGKIA